MFQNAVNKYLDVEGKPYVMRKSRTSAPASTNNAALAAPSHVLYSIDNAAVSSLADLERFINASSHDCSNPIWESNFSYVSEEYTRVAIVVDDEDSDSDSDNDHEQEENEAPTRVAIIEEDEDEDDEADGDSAEEVPIENPAKETFTRVAIQEDDSEDEEDETPEIVETNQQKIENANALKDEGNAQMKTGNVQAAAALYSQGLDRLFNCTPSKDVQEATVALTNNRSMAYINLKVRRNKTIQCTIKS